MATISIVLTFQNCSQISFGSPSGTVNGASSGTSSDASGMPSGAVIAFNLATCPSGWQPLQAAQGRYLVGVNPGGTLGAIEGTALHDQELRLVPQHSHPNLRSLWEHQCDPVTGVCSQNQGGDVNAGSMTWIANESGFVGDYAPGKLAAPYLQLLYCVKN
jgi:hypothetical protein